MTPLLLCSLALLGAGPSGPQAGDYGPPRLLVAAPDDPRYAHLSWPKLARTPDGVLILAYSAGRYHGAGGEGCPAVSLSTDQGQTFSEPRVLMHFDRKSQYDNCGNLALGMAEDGAAVLLAMAYTGNQRNTIVGWRSADSGKSWQPVDTSTLDESKTGSVFGGIFAVPQKGLAVTGHYRAGSEPHTTGIWIAYSSDHGKTWGQPQRLLDRALFEPSFVFTRDRLVGLIRGSSSATAEYWQAVSDDLGQTWQVDPWPPGGGDKNYRLPSPCVVVSARDPSRLYALRSQRHVQGNTPGHIDLWTAGAARLDWKKLGTLVTFPKEPGGHSDFSYPWMTPLDEERWLVVFYSGHSRGANSIYGLTIELK